MKVSISVGGKFHAFHLAEQLHKRGHLHKLVTSYPRFEVTKNGIPSSKIASLPAKEVLQRAWAQIPYWGGRVNLEYYLHTLFDLQARKHITRCDLVVAWAQFALYTLREARSNGAVTVVERGSSHIEYQREILCEEGERCGVQPWLPNSKTVMKETQEYAEADYISIPSRFVKRTFLQKGFPEEKLIVIPYGVDLGSFRQIPKDDNVFRVVFAGGLTLRKGVHYLLEAFASLKLSNAELVLAGGTAPEIQSFLRKYHGTFRYIGHIPQRDLFKWFSQGSVFVLFSIEEGLAMVLPQAMACGLPVICTTNTGGEDIVRDGVDGFILPIRDVEGLKEKLLYFYKRPEECKAMGLTAKKWVESRFTWNDYSEKIVSSYQDILSKRKSR